MALSLKFVPFLTAFNFLLKKVAIIFDSCQKVRTFAVAFGIAKREKGNVKRS